ncbi:MAG TPA: hypothetical protein VGV07_07840 [Devosia sp.]|jgi:hypothetical protein|uniref:hypothetical protein n=1 Tax=Devosia sp. TaxID=1871048 RepID=UPI002DDCAF4F|nr:hypothetical protein [Devosia sp.]HEV2515145.1 hypothetical protein [Devosia sp.]
MPHWLAIEIAWFFAALVTDVATKGQKSPGQAAGIAGLLDRRSHREPEHSNTPAPPDITEGLKL